MEEVPGQFGIYMMHEKSAIATAFYDENVIHNTLMYQMLTVQLLQQQYVQG